MTDVKELEKRIDDFRTRIKVQRNQIEICSDNIEQFLSAIEGLKDDIKEHHGQPGVIADSPVELEVEEG